MAPSSNSPALLLLEHEHPADLDTYRAGIEALGLGDRLELVCATTEADAIALASRCSMIAAKAHGISQPIVDAMPDLRWIQALTSGTDHLAKLRLPEDIVVTSMRGIHGPQMAELAILLMMSLVRDYPRMLENQRQRRWERFAQPVLQDKRLLVIGIGAIALALAGRAAAFGMDVHGISDGRNSAPGFSTVRPYRAMMEELPEADFVVLLTPYEPRTHRLVDAEFLAAMAPHAYLLNLARGGVVDEVALTKALQARSIAGAAFDVFAQEPLPTDDPLWTAPNLLIKPHIGGMSDRYASQALALLCDNLAAFLDGRIRAMANIVEIPPSTGL